MKFIEAVIFDLDDTLIPNGEYYSKTIGEVGTLIKNIIKKELPEAKCSSTKISQELDSLDIINAHKYGLGRERFTLSAIDIYHTTMKKYCLNTKLEDIKKIHVFTSTVFNEVERISPEVENTLKKLNLLNIPIYLLTAGDKVIQSSKIYQSGAHKYFKEENVYIVSEKIKKTYETILKEKNIQACVMIGNSLRSDINPAIESGLYAIHIDKGVQWEYDNAVLMESTKIYKTDSFEEITSILTRINKTINTVNFSSY